VSAIVADLGGGVFRITHPLPYALDHVHCYAVRGADGWTLIDTGLGTPTTGQGWREALAELGHPRVQRVVITHYHPDHIGGSAMLVELTGPEEVVQSARDAELTRSTWNNEQNRVDLEQFLLDQGMPPATASESAFREGALPVSAAAPTRLVGEGDTLDLDGETFDVLVLPGHADGHIALMGQRTGRLFGGDVLLQGITPTVGTWHDTEFDPLGRYLATLERISDLAPAVVFPGHRRLVEEPRTRAEEIVEHHVHRLEAHREALRAGAVTPYEVTFRLWSGELGYHERRFALVEAVSHLTRLEQLGLAEEAEPGRWRAL